MSKDEFIRKARQAHGDKYDYFKSDYENARKAVVIICPEHGEFKQHPANHMKGVGCPSCASYGFKPNQPALLYYLRIENRVLTFYKIGITNRTVEERFPPQDMAMIQVLKTWEYEKGLDAYAREQEVLAEFAEYRYRGLETVLSSVGNSEFFIKDVLGLDS